jgi:hypothetical protein
MNPFYLLLFLLFVGCSSGSKNLHPKMKLRPTETPIALLPKHEDLSSNLVLTFELEYPPEMKENLKPKFLMNAIAHSLKTIYLMGYTLPKIDTSDLRASHCDAYKVKKMNLECTSKSHKKAWNPQKTKESLSQYYWAHRFNEDFLTDWGDKFGVFITFVREHSSDLELLGVDSSDPSQHKMNFKFSRMSEKPNYHFPIFKLTILEQRLPTIELSSVFSFFAVKKTDGYLAPIMTVSPEFQSFKRKNVILVTQEQGEDYVSRIKALYQSLNVENYLGCPIRLNECHFPEFVNFKDETKVDSYYYERGNRDHILGLLMLAHTKFVQEPPQGNKITFTYTIDMKTLMSSYKIMPNRAFLETIQE